MTNDGDSARDGQSGSSPSKDNTADGRKPRAQAGDFEKQVAQIRKDIATVRANLAAAEKALSKTEALNASNADKPKSTAAATAAATVAATAAATATATAAATPEDVTVERVSGEGAE